MYQIESQITGAATKGASTSVEVLCHLLKESLSSIHAVTRLSTMLGIPVDTMAELLAPLGILKGQGMDVTRLGALLHTAKVLGVIEEYAITKEPHCLGQPLTVREPEGPEGLSIRVELPAGWLVELDLPGVALANEERIKRKYAENKAVTCWNSTPA